MPGKKKQGGQETKSTFSFCDKMSEFSGNKTNGR